MHKHSFLSARLAWLATVLLTAVWSMPSYANSVCGVAVRFDCISIATNASKVGFPAFIQDNQNPTIYFGKRAEQTNYTFAQWFSTNCDHAYGAPSFYTNTSTFFSSDVTGYDQNTRSITNGPVSGRASVYDYHCYFWYDVLSSSFGSNCLVSPYICTSDRLNLTTWSDTACLAAAAHYFGWPTQTNITADSWFVTWEASCASLCEGNTNQPGQICYWQWTRTNLLSPYSFNQFMADYGNLGSTWPSWTNSTRNASADRGGTNVVTWLGADRAEFRANYSKFKYRVAVLGPKGQRQTFRWREIFLPNAGGPIRTLRNFEITVTLSGEEQILSIDGANERIVLPPDEPGRITLADQPEWTCGDETCHRFAQGGLSSGSISLKFGLGTSTWGEPAGFLYVHQESPTSSLGTPQTLRAFVNHGVEVIPPSGTLRQVRSAQGLADIVPDSGSQYSIRFYSNPGTKGGDGYYQPTDSPLASWSIATSDGNQLAIIETSPSHVRTNSYVWSAADSGWTFLPPDGLSAQTRGSVTSGNLRTETFAIGPVGGQAVYREVSVFQSFTGLGELLVASTNGAGGPNPVGHAWAYYDTPAVPGVHGRVQQHIGPSGAWERYEYTTNGYPTKVVSCYLDSSVTDTNEGHHRVTELSYAPVDGADSGLLEPDLARREIKKVLGQEIARLYRIVTVSQTVEIRGQRPGAQPGDTDNVRSTNKVFAAASFDGMAQGTLSPDGTAQIIWRPFFREGQPRTETTLTGSLAADGASVGDGTMSVTTLDALNRVATRQTWDVVSGQATVPLASETYSYQGEDNRPVSITYLDGTSALTSYNCCELDSTTDRDGTVTSYTYDALRRVLTTTRAGITTSNVFDAAGNVLATVRLGTDGTAMIINQATFDLAGRQVTSADGLTNTTTFTQNTNGTIRTNMLPNNATRIESLAKDGTLLRLTGTAVHGVRYTNFVESDGSQVMQEIKLSTNGTDTAEWVKNYTDMLGRPFQTVYPDNAASRSYYNTQGQLVRQVDPDGVATAFAYNAKGEVEFTTNGPHRVTRTLTEITGDTRRVLTLAQIEGGGWVTNAIRETGLTSERSTEIRQGATTSTFSQTLGNGQRQTVQTAPDQSATVSFYVNGRLQSVTRQDAHGAQMGRTDYGYDTQGRQVFVTDARNGTVTNTFDNADRLASTTAPAPGPGQNPPTTSYVLDAVGNAVRVVYPDNTSVTNDYWLTGEPKSTVGSRAYPAAYTYDYAGRMATMTTWQTYPSTGAAMTTWLYDGQRGWLTNKLHAGGAPGPSYTYTTGGRLRTRAWARGTTTTYTTNAYGGLASVSYNDGVTATVSFNPDLRGRVTNIVQGSTSTLLRYNDAGQLVSETCNGITVSNTYDGFLRRTNLTALNSTTALLQYAYAFDAAARLQTVSDGVNTVTYGYLANSPLVQDTTFRRNGTAMLQTTRVYDRLNRLQQISSLAANSKPLLSAYGYNAANQRVALTNAGNSRWVFGYDNLGQVTSGKKYWNDNLPVAGEQFEYVFDDIGNRKQTQAGSSGAMRTANYTMTNLLNQIASRDVPGTVDMLGSATGAVVTVNGATAYRHGEFFQKAVTTTNSAAPVWLSLSVTSSGSTVTGNAFLPRTPEAFGYDADGNLTNDGRWVLMWDAENRLTKLESRADAPTASKRKIEFTYDWQGRLVRRVESDGSGGGYTITSDTRLVYDGWQCVAEFNGTNTTPARTYAWGLDLSGTPTGAGGVGGLLWLNSAASGTHYYTFDGNGNVTALVRATDGTVSAQYEYGPFGEALRASGAMAKENPFRFSTKRTDNTSEQVHYEYRIYKPATGTWLSRDPSGENGGDNLYVFSGNNGVTFFDILGLEWKIKRETSKNWAIAESSDSEDTKQSLAQLIHLSYSEFDKWAKPAGCRSYFIPNTVVVYTSKKRGWDHWPIPPIVNTLRTLAVRSGKNYENKGFKVVYQLNRSSEELFISLWQTDGIFAYAFGGHGSSYQNQVYGFEAAPGSESAVSPDQVSPPYHLQAIGAYSCSSAKPIVSSNDPNKTVKWRELISTSGTFIGYVNDVWWLNVWWNEESVNPGIVPP